MTDEHEGADGRWMRLAIEAAERGIAAGQTPFGASIVREGQLVVAAHNVVWATTDITAHAEVNAIRLACRALGTIDLSGCDIFCTCEPCPMCFGAIHWARFDRLVYAASVADAAGAGFGELDVSNADLKRLGNAPVELVPGFMADEGRRLFDLWKRSPTARPYGHRPPGRT